MPRPDLDELWRLAVALDRRYERLERLMQKFLAALEARERPQPPPSSPPPLH